MIQSSVRELRIDAPADSATDGLPPVPQGMKAWRNAKNNFVVVACHYTADPLKRSNEWYNKATKNLRPDQIERELEINFESRAGAKCFPFLEYNEAVYRIEPPNPIPAHWKIIAGLDYGATNPTSINLYAIDEHKRFWCFWEFYKPSNVIEISKVLLFHPLWHRISYVVADPSIFNKNQTQIITKETGNTDTATIMSIGEMLLDRGIINIHRGNNNRLAGMERVRTMFNWRGTPTETRPRLFISPHCPKTWWELNNLVFKPDDDPDKNVSEDCVKRNDHAFDQIKYSLLSWDLPQESPIDNRAGFATLKNIEDEIDERYNNEDRDVFSVKWRDLDDEIDDF